MGSIMGSFWRRLHRHHADFSEPRLCLRWAAWSVLHYPRRHGLRANLMIFGGLIVWFLIVEPHGLAKLWSIGKQKLRLWPFPH